MSVLFESLVFRRRWNDVVEHALIDGEVHEADSEFFLNLGLFLNVLLHNHAHFFNCVHFGLLSNENPIFELLVEVKSCLSSLFELIESPVSNLGKSIPEDSFLNSHGFSHFLDINAVLNFFCFLLSGCATLLGVLLAGLFAIG